MSNRFPNIGKENESFLYNSDELFDLFLNCTADGFAFVDLENRFIRVNPMYTKIFGYTSEEILGKRFNEFSNPSIVNEIIESVKQGKVYSNMITQRFHKDGTTLDIAVSYSPFRNSNGEIIAIIAIFRDITELKQMERELEKIRELYKLITENTSDMIKVFSKEKTIIYASPSHEKVMGYSPEELVGKKIHEIMVPGEEEHFDWTFQKLLKTEEPQLIQNKVRTSNNDVIYLESNISPIYNEQKEMEAFVTVGRNISDRVKNDAALRNLDRLSIIGQLAAGVAHEIRNPLTSLKGFSKLLRSNPDPHKQDQYLSIIMNELDRIDMIVNEFMSLAKPQAILFEREKLFSILHSTINVLHPQALLHNVQIILEDLIEDVDLLCSPHQLKQVFVNFLKNAIESMPNGGTVEIRVQKLENKGVLITFKDEGIGIEEDLLRYLGTPFYTTKDKGIGLGLTVSNKIIQEHNGSMTIESQLGIGTSVSVRLDVL
ncbi:PAS domain-containing sensor histidine kinase [Peribacillus alkalitolerans]|uniref:PAS domain-containing sensor histidine kinase n=1 Tax=Peribacillus alkalitolerans TaxID=1550385 RepID=UPI0013D543EA|nr:PAS domain S-box protein [Peribacillus alkalitolerans]